MTIDARRRRLWAVFSMPPPTLDTDRWVTVSYPPTVGTVVSVSAAGVVGLQPPGTQTPCELAVLKPDRVIYAPRGAAGAAYRLAYAGTEIPNA